MHEIRELIQLHGNLFYLITFLWTALEGETFVIFAGFAAQKGMLNFGWLFIAAWLGTFCGDQVFFFTGRRFGLRILDHLPKLKPAVDRSLSWLEQHAVGFILAYRFMYGIRNISGIAIGMSHLSCRKFMIWNAIAAFVWATVFAGFGYVFGDVIAHMHHKTQQVEESVHQVMLAGLGLFIFIITARLAISAYQRRRKKAEFEKAAKDEVQ
jgi:membrane protein DedA with SNARE-associated domain